MRVLLTAVLFVAGSAFAADLECSRSCDELMKGMAADCRKAGKGGDHHGGEAEHGGAEACQSVMKKLRASCLKDCSSSQKKKKR